MSVTVEQIKELRDASGVSIMQCKKALEEVDGDMEKAQVILRKESATIAKNKSGRSLGSGVASAYIHAGGSVVGAVVLECETDFVAKNKEFVQLAYDIAMHVAAMNPHFLAREDVKEEDIVAARSVFEKEAKDTPKDMMEKVVEGKLNSYLKEKVLLEQAFVKNQDVTIGELIQEATQKFGENIALTRFERLSL